MSKLGDKIKEIRINEGLSQEAFAKELGYTSKSTINKIEKGINEISYDKLMLLIDKYNLPDPAKLWNNNEWTWSAFNELLNQAQTAFNNDLAALLSSDEMLIGFNHFNALNFPNIVYKNIKIETKH